MRIDINNTMSDAVDNFNAVFPIALQFYGPPRDPVAMRLMKQLYDIEELHTRTFLVVDGKHFLMPVKMRSWAPQLEEFDDFDGLAYDTKSGLLSLSNRRKDSVHLMKRCETRLTVNEESLIDYEKSSKKRRRKKPR